MYQLEAGNSVSAKQLTTILARRRVRIVVVFAVIFAAVVAGTLLTPKQYEARLKVLVKNERADMTISADRESTTLIPGEVSEAQINTEIELLNNANLLREVVIRCGLDRLQHSGSSDPAERGSIEIEKAVARLRKDLDVSAVRKANIIQAQYADSDPERAAAVLGKLAELYMQEHLKVHGVPGTYEFFKGQAARYQHELEAAEAKVADFSRRENIVKLAEQKDVILQRAADAESALMQSDAAVRDYTSKISDTRQRLAATEPRILTQSRTVSNQYSVERLHTMLAELQNRRTQLLAKFRPDDRMVVEIEAEISDTQASLEKAMKLTGSEQATDVNPLHQTLEADLDKDEAELAGIKARRESLVRQQQAYDQQLRRLSNDTAQYDDLARDQKEAEDNYLLYAKKTEEARIAESLDQQKISNVVIAETPSVPHVPSKPNVPLDLALGALLAGFLSLGSAFGAEYMNDTVDHSADLEELTGLPVLATAYIHSPVAGRSLAGIVPDKPESHAWLPELKHRGPSHGDGGYS